MGSINSCNKNKKTMAHLVPRPISIQNAGLYAVFFLYIPNGTPAQLPIVVTA